MPRRATRIFLFVLALALVGAGGWYAWRMYGAPAPAAALLSTGAQTYTNSVYNFSVEMPAGFSAAESEDLSSGNYTVVLQNKTGDGIQIVVSPFDDDTGQGYALTADRIHEDLPMLKIDDAQPVEVGAHYTGLAFLSDNPAFGGASREVWFVFRGNLYQISTYARLDDLLKQMFGTWQFT